MSEKSVFFKLMQLFAELYPLWKEGLLKNRQKKETVFAGYKRILKDVTDDHLTLLAAYLDSPLNTQHRKWPPTPLELSQLFDMHKKKLQRKTVTFPSPSQSGSSPNAPSLGYWLGQVFFYSKEVENAPAEWQPYIFALQQYRQHPDYKLFCQFHLLYCSLTDQDKYSPTSAYDHMTHPDQRFWLLETLGVSDIDLEEVEQFFISTRLSENLYHYLTEKAAARE